MLKLPNDSQCRTCFNFNGSVSKDRTEDGQERAEADEYFTCRAFERIPTEIATNEVSHKEHVKGDNGIKWEPEP